MGFYKSIWSYIAIILFAAPLFAATDFFEARLSLEWRRWLCRELMNGYYANQAHFRLHQLTEAELDNPDQVMLPSHATLPGCIHVMRNTTCQKDINRAMCIYEDTGHLC